MKNRKHRTHPTQVKKDTPGKECPLLYSFTSYIISHFDGMIWYDSV